MIHTFKKIERVKIMFVGVDHYYICIYRCVGVCVCVQTVAYLRGPGVLDLSPADLLGPSSIFRVDYSNGC